MSTTAKIDPLDMQPPRPVIFGEVLFDCFGENEVPGGAPLNVAWHLHALGWNPLLISRVGQDDAGRAMVTRMRDWGLDTTGIQHDMQHQTGRVEVRMEGKSHTFEILPDQAYDYIEPEVARCAVNLRQCGVLYHGSLALRGNSRVALERLHDAADAPIFLDINLRDPFWAKDEVLGMIRRAGMLKLNEDELELLKPDNLAKASIEESARQVRSEWELDALWLTLGKEGALYCAEGDETLRIKPDDQDAPVVDTVGAGDAFSAALLGGFLKGSSPGKTAECATLLATRICGQQGATAMDPDVYEGLEAVTNGG